MVFSLSWQRVAHANLLGQLSKFRLGPLHLEDRLVKVEEPSEPSLVRLFCQCEGKLGLLKNLVILLLQPLSAIGGPRKTVRPAPSALNEVCANAQLETQRCRPEAFLSPPCLRAFTCAGVMSAYHAMQIPIYAGHEWRGVPNVVAIINIASCLGKECNDL